MIGLVAALAFGADPIDVAATAEAGFLGVAANQIQFGKRGTPFDYVADGGENILFPFVRLQIETSWQRQRFTFLYQPLDLRSEVQLTDPLRVDDVRFDAGTPVDLQFGFSFWRLSWGHALLDGDDGWLVVGVGLQIRNATIGFTAVDGSARHVARDIGPVPLLEVMGHLALGKGAFLEAEIDGFYAPIKYINGSGSDVEGAIADFSLRAGVEVHPGVRPFIGIRYLGGGAEGTSANPDPGRDGYVSNWLHFGTVSLGVRAGTP